MLKALFKGLVATAEGVAEFFRVLPAALGVGMADTMVAHGRDPNAGLGIALEFAGPDHDDATLDAISHNNVMAGGVPLQAKDYALYYSQLHTNGTFGRRLL